MQCFVNDYDFLNMPAQKYYSYPKSKDDEFKRQDSTDKILSGEWLGATKKDGFFCKAIKDNDGNVVMTSRAPGVDGSWPNHCPVLPQFKDFWDAVPNGTCILCELYFPDNPGSNNVTTVLGCLPAKALERQKDSPLYMYVFDMLAYNGTLMMSMPAVERFASLSSLPITDYVSVAHYLCGQELYEAIQKWLEDGEEGAVITKGSALYVPGKRPSHTLKIKQHLSDSIDCFFTGTSTMGALFYNGKDLEHWHYFVDREGKKYLDPTYRDGLFAITKDFYYNRPASFQVAVLDENGNDYPIGYISNLPEDMKDNIKDYYRRPISITAMSMYKDDDHIAFRHPIFDKVRDDLQLSDCTLDKIC